MSADREADLAALRVPFDSKVVGKLPKGGAQLDYVGHAAVTDRLLSVDPEWNWEPLSLGENGQPVFTRNQSGAPTALWIKLTVAGVTRIGVGTVAPNAFDAEKQLIGDALRNAAMRFGVALDLWSKDELESTLSDDKPKRQRPAAPASSTGGGGEPSGGSVPALASKSATRRTPNQGEVGQGTKQVEPTASIEDGSSELTGHAGDSVSPASLAPAAVTARFGALNQAQRALVRAQMSSAKVSFADHPAECDRIMREVVDAGL